MIRKAMTIGVLGWMLVMHLSAVAAESEIQLIVNSANPTNSISKHQAQRIFMKKEIRWDHGVKISPVDLGPEDPVRQLFSNDFLGKNLSAVKNYWQQMAFSGRATPPIEYEREIDVMRFVANNPGAIGYVSADATLIHRLKRLVVED
jgi:ABC-type phosphate transport system substrate-binding protein